MDSVDKAILCGIFIICSALYLGYDRACHHELEMAKQGYEQVRAEGGGTLWMKSQILKAER